MIKYMVNSKFINFNPSDASKHYNKNNTNDFVLIDVN